jgi:hypothetical protein
MNNNPIKRKTSFWSIIEQVYGEGILIFTALLVGIPAGIFIPYWAGQLFYKITKFKSKGIVDYWFAGFITLSLLAVIIVILLMLIDFIRKLIGSLIVANKITYLPTTEEELKALKINTFDEFDAFMLDFFGTHKTLNTADLWDLLSYKLVSCYKLLPPPENNAHLKAYKKDKEKYMLVRARLLAAKIERYRSWANDIEYMKKINSEAQYDSMFSR